MKKKILILANNDIGLYKFRKELIQELLSQGSVVYISLPDGEYIKELEKIGCKFINTEVDRRGLNPVSDLKLLFEYLRIINQIKPEFVITYTIKPNIYGGIACRIKKVPYAINITGLGTAFQNSGLLKTAVIALYKFACRNARVVFFENEDNQKKFVDAGIIPIEKTCKLNGAGVNFEEYPFTEYPPEGVTRFLFIGRVMKEKGVDELFDAAKKIKAEYNQVEFDIVGPMEDDYKETIERLVEQGVINYFGYQNDVKPFIERCHCFVLPSYHEGMANTLLEAGAMGRPLITSDIPGCREAVVDGKTGFLVKVKSSNALNDSFVSFINKDYSVKKLFGYSSYLIVSEKFDKCFIIKNTVEYLL